MKNNNRSNRIIKWLVMAGDFVVLNVVMMVLAHLEFTPNWAEWNYQIIVLVNNIALMLAMLRFSTIIHLRLVGADAILRRLVGLTVIQAVFAFLLLRLLGSSLWSGSFQLSLIIGLFVILTVKRFAERWLIKLYREAGHNTRMVTLVGSDPELIRVFRKLVNDATLGYRVLGYYGEESLKQAMKAAEDDVSRTHDPWITDKTVYLERIGSMEDFVRGMAHPETLTLGDELYLCVSRTEKSIIRQVAHMCDRRIVRFFYVPVSVESIGLKLRRELLDDMEIFSTVENPLQNSMNRTIKRVFDIVLSIVFLIPMLILFPFIWLIMKIQSPGPIFFKQERTGMDGKNFTCLKFRSMHVNADADKVQATKNDPRKYPFGNFMRKSNIDELPQFINVLRGDMSIVGPRPHMLAHTEQYSQLIDRYMVRHFVKPGITGWAQVTGYRGETKELWQMEERVRRDIWYMENWSIWLDIRIIWMTVKTLFVFDKKAY